MTAIKTSIKRTQKMIEELEKKNHERIILRIKHLGFDPDDVLNAFRIGNPFAKARLMVFLEYEELKELCRLKYVNEVRYACSFYPTVVINYIYYLLDEIGVPPIEELEIYKQLISEQHPDVIKEFEQLERKWKLCVEEM
jgi:hypothetical protein